MACKDKKKKKRVFGKFTINRLAGVDRPMQGDALQVIMKRRDSEEGEFEDQEVDIYKGYRLLSVVEGHTHMILDADASGHTSWTDGKWEAEVYEEGHSHPWVKNDDSSLSIGTVNDHTHEVIIKSDTTGSSGGQHKEVIEMADVKKTDTGDLQVVQKKLEGTQADLTKALALAEMDDVTKAFYKNLSDSEKDAFIVKSAEEKAGMISKAKESDPITYTGNDGMEYRKSDGEKMINLAKRADKSLAIAKAATEKAETEAFEKGAKDLGFLPGSNETKVAILKAVDGIEDADLKKKALELLNAGNMNLKKAFETQGVQGDGPHDETNPVNKLDVLAKKHAADKGIGYEKAYVEVLDTDEGKALYADIETPVIH